MGWWQHGSLFAGPLFAENILRSALRAPFCGSPFAVSCVLFSVRGSHLTHTDVVYAAPQRVPFRGWCPVRRTRHAVRCTLHASGRRARVQRAARRVRASQDAARVSLPAVLVQDPADRCRPIAAGRSRTAVRCRPSWRPDACRGPLYYMCAVFYAFMRRTSFNYLGVRGARMGRYPRRVYLPHCAALLPQLPAVRYSFTFQAIAGPRSF